VGVLASRGDQRTGEGGTVVGGRVSETRWIKRGMIASLAVVAADYLLTMASMMFGWQDMFGYLFWVMVVSAVLLVGFAFVDLRRGGS
jgi:hypothetical protein